MMEHHVAVPVNGKTRIFDDHHPPLPDLLNVCVHCGFCLATCPTYTLWGKEMDSPRGRIHLMNLALEGDARLSDVYVAHFDHCLGCLACVTTCPSGVKYGKLIDAVRGQLQRHYRRTLRERLLRRMIKAIFPYPSRLRKLAVPLRLYQRLGLQRLARALGLTALLPPSVQAMDKLLPNLSHEVSNHFPARVEAQGGKRRAVALLTGCVQSAFFAHVNAATVRVLAAEGCEVIVPPEQGCCGALMLDLGDEEAALDMARRMIDCMEQFPVDAIIVNAAGCGSTVKEYGYLLRDDPQYRDRAIAFSAKCKDLSEVLAELEPRAPRHPLPMRAAYHDACHLQHAQGVREQPRAVLRSIPGLEVLELPEAALCCGSAGIYNLVQPDTARELGERKAQKIASTPAELVITGNPGCQLQISSSLKGNGHPLPVMHYAELLDASIRGRNPLANA